MTPRAEELNKIMYSVDKAIGAGMTPFQAMDAMLEDDDWLLVYIAFKTLVAEANK